MIVSAGRRHKTTSGSMPMPILPMRGMAMQIDYMELTAWKKLYNDVALPDTSVGTEPSCRARGSRGWPSWWGCSGCSSSWS
jgi:hypothetical protein